MILLLFSWFIQAVILLLLAQPPCTTLTMLLAFCKHLGLLTTPLMLYLFLPVCCTGGSFTNAYIFQLCVCVLGGGGGFETGKLSLPPLSLSHDLKIQAGTIQMNGQD